MINDRYLVVKPLNFKLSTPTKLLLIQKQVPQSQSDVVVHFNFALHIPGKIFCVFKSLQPKFSFKFLIL